MSCSSTPAQLSKIVDELCDLHACKYLFHSNLLGGRCPSGISLESLVLLSRELFFPGFYGEERICEETLNYHTGVKCVEMYNLLREQFAAGYRFGLREQDTELSDEEIKARADKAAIEVLKEFPRIRKILATDVLAAYNADPAATSLSEVVLCYPAIRAITNYRLAHAIYKIGVPIIPRIITEIAHSETGIDIHPAAQIGSSFTIDHGTGVVIGATTIIGDRVKLYQGVTLGARSFPLNDAGNPIKGVARHPILEDGVVVYSNATILGRITIGHDAVIGGNIWLTHDVEPNERLIQRK
ncbi:MAG: serine acetyltransferase [Bacteroidaceae bacterium]|nr:serine acetyltransferase [Bacteroidaceae bacterium]